MMRWLSMGAGKLRVRGLLAVGAAVALAALAAVSIYGAQPASTTGEETAWEFHVDCDPVTAGVQSSCTVGSGRISVDIVVKNNSPISRRLGAFGWNLVTDQAVLDPVVTACDMGSGLDCNPDFDGAANPGSWACAPLAPRADVNPSPAIADSVIGCFNGAVNASPIAAGASQRLGSVLYDAHVGNATLHLVDGNLYNENFGELGSCNWIISVPMACPETTIVVDVAPVPTATPCADTDCDGVADAIDNCPNVPNASQKNVDNEPINMGAQGIDLTRPMSDLLGDSCDPDSDGDGLLDPVEGLPNSPWVCAGGVKLGYTAVYEGDTDGDRYLDSAECLLGTSPLNGVRYPQLTQCGPTTVDTDGDKIADRIEFCFYNTSPTNTDSDGDGVRDGCEIASLNSDTVVNTSDLGIIAAALNSAPKYHVNIDINKDGVINVADLGLASSLTGAGQCP